MTNKAKNKNRKNNKKTTEGEVAPFGNMLTGFEFNETCMVVSIVFLILFMYKEEIMRSKVIKNLLK